MTTTTKTPLNDEDPRRPRILMRDVLLRIGREIGTMVNNARPNAGRGKGAAPHAFEVSWSLTTMPQARPLALRLIAALPVRGLKYLPQQATAPHQVIVSIKNVDCLRLVEERHPIVGPLLRVTLYTDAC